MRRTCSLIIVVSSLLTLVGCASKPTATEVGNPVTMQPAVWAPKRIYAPLDSFTRSGAETILRSEAKKDCGPDFESRAFLVHTTATELVEPTPMLALEYACLGDPEPQGDFESIAPAVLRQ